MLRIALTGCAIAALLGGGWLGDPAVAKADERATVLEVVDGDTIDVELGGGGESVRLIGIDTPEVYFGAECGGAEASAAMRRLIGPGDRVRLIRDRTQDNRDPYGRLLRYVEDRGRDLGRRQIRRGWAKPYVFEDAFRRVGSYRLAKRRAAAGDAGVWGACGGDFSRSALTDAGRGLGATGRGSVKVATALLAVPARA